MNHNGQATVLFLKGTEVDCPGCGNSFLAFKKDVRLEDPLNPMSDTFRGCTPDLTVNATLNDILDREEVPHCPYCNTVGWWNLLLDHAHKVMNSILQEEWKEDLRG